jgi:hypothetical protein
LSTWQRTLDPRIRGTLLASVEPTAQAGGWKTIVKLDADSPLQAAGAAVGDSVRWRHQGEAWLRRFGTDEHIEVELQSAGAVRVLTIQLVPDPGFSLQRSASPYIADWLAQLSRLLIGSLLALRRSDSPAIRGLAVSLILGSSLEWYSLPSGNFRE